MDVVHLDFEIEQVEGASCELVWGASGLVLATRVLRFVGHPKVDLNAMGVSFGEDHETTNITAEACPLREGLRQSWTAGETWMQSRARKPKYPQAVVALDNNQKAS